MRKREGNDLIGENENITKEKEKIFCKNPHPLQLHYLPLNQKISKAVHKRCLPELLVSY